MDRQCRMRIRHFMHEVHKPCRGCRKVLPLSSFYVHPRMSDGHLNKCKECVKQRVRKHYEAIGGTSEYERERAQRPERKAAQQDMMRVHRVRHPNKYKARTAVSNAVRDGRLQRQPCRVCGTTERVQAHHKDYSRPLDVDWLCFQHHREEEHDQTVRDERLRSKVIQA